MKICIIGHPRTRSSLLLDSLCSQYAIPIIGETGNRLGTVPTNLYQQLVIGWLKQIESKNEGVVRIHPTQLSFLQCSRNSKIINLTWLKFNQYDKIYFTVRKNLPELISSLFVAHTLKKFTYQDKREVYNNIQPVELRSTSYFQSVEILLYSEIIMNIVKEYLMTHSIEWEELDYDTIPKHIEEHYTNANTSHVETEYDYRSIVTNYNELQSIYEQLKPIVYSRFYTDNQVDK